MRTRTISMSTRLATLAVTTMLLGANGSDAQAAHPHRPNTPTAKPNYSGTYDMTYNALNGSVDVCVSVGPQHVCNPVAIDIPLHDGVATADSLMFITDELTALLTELAPNLPSELYPSYESMINYVFPLLVAELNTALAQLPPTMMMTERTNSPVFTAAMTVKGKNVMMPGQLDLTTGMFKVVPETMYGQIFADAAFRGAAVAEVPLNVSASTGYPTPTGSTSTLEVSLRGRLGADVSMVRQ